MNVDIPVPQCILPNYNCEPNIPFYSSEYKIDRRIFLDIEFTKFEIQKLEQLMEYLQTLPQKDKIPSNTPIQTYLKCLHGRGFKIKQSAEILFKHFEFREKYIPYGYQNLYNPNVINILNSGAFYVYGRTKSHDPIIVMDYGKISLEKVDIEDYIQAGIFILEYIIHKMLVPGKVETWFILVDYNNFGLTDLPRSMLKRLVEVMVDNYICRLSTEICVNVSKIVRFVYWIVKGFLDEITTNKIHLYSESKPSQLLNFIDPDQLQQKYGGTQPDATSYWPPYVPC